MLALLALSSVTGTPAATADSPVLEGLDLPAELLAFALSPDGRRAALALPSDTKDRSRRTLLRLHSVDETSPSELKINGLVRDLAFSAEGTLVFVLEHRPAKRGEGETYLLVFDFEKRNLENRMRMPPAAGAIERSADGRSLLIPLRDEIRTITIPQLRSGPLFRVAGDNRTIAATGGTQVVIGQDAALLVVDLADRQGREGMPIRLRVETSAAVVFIELQEEENRAIARLADGTDLTVSLDPIATTPLEAAAPVAAPSIVEAPQVPKPKPEPAVEFSLPPAPAAPAAAPVADGAQVRGTVRDAAADLQISVVFLGPDNILREAKRARVAPDGTWQVSGLPAGRYRIQLDAGGSRVLVTEPPFQTVEIGQGPASAVIADFRISGAL